MSCPSVRGTILTIIDRFSKVAHFITLPALPTSREIADILEAEIVVPSMQVHMRCCQCTWNKACAALLRATTGPRPLSMFWARRSGSFPRTFPLRIDRLTLFCVVCLVYVFYVVGMLAGFSCYLLLSSTAPS
ncbi:unnamed protein product [Merluccius merluccius]